MEPPVALLTTVVTESVSLLLSVSLASTRPVPVMLAVITAEVLLL